MAPLAWRVLARAGRCRSDALAVTARPLARRAASAAAAAPRKLPPVSQSPLWRRYDERVRDGALRPDQAQRRTVRRLARLGQLLELEARAHDDPPPPPPPQQQQRPSRTTSAAAASARSRSAETDPERGRRAPRGLYIWGGVGTGKSMLMDLFFESVTLGGGGGRDAAAAGGANGGADAATSGAAETRAPRKRRVHFHSFMLEVWRNVWRHRTT